MSTLDWKKCIICQISTKEPLKCPLNSYGESEINKKTYFDFLENVRLLREANALPRDMLFGDEVDAECLRVNNACWHKSCRLKFSSSKVKKAQKRSSQSAASSCTEKEEILSPKYRRRNPEPAESSKKCIFCNDRKNDKLHSFAMLETDRSIRQMAIELGDFELLGRISEGDLIAIEAKYHLKCLMFLKNRYRSHCIQKANDGASDEQMDESVAFIELVEHMDGCVENGTNLFKISELATLYIARLEALGIKKMINKTRLKNALLKHYDEALQEQTDGKNTILVFKNSLTGLLKECLKERDFSEDAKILAKAATIIRKDLFAHKGFNFSGCFPLDCQSTSLPSSLKSLVSMVLNGLDIKDQEKVNSQVCLTICQTIVFNAKKKSYYNTKTSHTRHSASREPPFPLYLGLCSHSSTRSKTLIDKLYQMGLTVSYDRIMEIEDTIANSLCARFKEDGCVSPACLKKGIFSVGALDNLDHNTSSTTSVSSFHGTGISIFQFPTEDRPGESRPPLLVRPTTNERQELPESYATVPAVALNTSSMSVPLSNIIPLEGDVSLDDAKRQECQWVSHAIAKLDKDVVNAEDAVGWAAYHSKQQQPNNHPAITVLLPLFYEKADSPAMVKHGMDVLKQTISFLNPGQIPVITLDQPLFAMFGGLHLETAMWCTVGDILEGSGWTTVLTKAEVASSGIAQSLLKLSHLTRTRHAHQVTLLALHSIKKEAYSAASRDGSSFTEWEETMRNRSPTFFFWDLIMKYETLILIFVRAHRNRDFCLFLEVLEYLVPLFFALDHINYARWVPIHIRDMKSLPESVRREFKEHGHWVISKTGNRFSSMPLDQAHEQENKMVKGSGGTIGLTENPVAFRRWMLSGPELSRLIREFEDNILPNQDPDNPKNFQNHEAGSAAQRTFHRQIKNVCEVIRRTGNPFLDNFPELVTIDSRDCADAVVVETISKLEQLGKEQYQKYVREVIEKRTSAIHNPIKKNNLPLFQRNHKKETSKQGKKAAVLRSNVKLFAQLYVALQSREGDMKEFFSHEVQSFPPALSEFGNLRLPTAKSDIMKCLVPASHGHADQPSQFDCKVFDGAVIVHSLPSAEASTFDDYVERIFLPHLNHHLQQSQRINVVWDTYVPDSLKEAARDKRGVGIRRKVAGQTKLPKKWMMFLRDPNNKSELFAFLTSKVAEFAWAHDKSIYITSGSSVVSCGKNEPAMDQCNHEEADTRIVVHVRHAMERGAVSVLVRTVDSDVVVILVGKFYDLLAYNDSAQIWVAFGMGRHYSLISINRICTALGESKSRALPVFHALTGCDCTSQFCGIGKLSAWKARDSNRGITTVLENIATHPFQQLAVTSETFQQLERFTVVMYDKASPLQLVNEARLELFSKRNRDLDCIPPTQDALLQHAKRAVYQAGIWTTSEQANRNVPSPAQFSWEKGESGAWKPIWMTIPKVSAVCRELIKCQCKGRCIRCKCAKEHLKCTSLCKCRCHEIQS